MPWETRPLGRSEAARVSGWRWRTCPANGAGASPPSQAARSGLWLEGNGKLDGGVGNDVDTGQAVSIPCRKSFFASMFLVHLRKTAHRDLYPSSSKLPNRVISIWSACMDLLS